MSKPTSSGRLYLIRHGEVPGNHAGCFVGRSDPQLSSAGVAQIQQQAQQLQARLQLPCRIICSPLQRARQSAQILAAALGNQHVQIDPELREIDFGAWEMLDFQQASARNPEAVQQWCREPATFVFPDGDAVADFLARINATAQRLTALAEHGDLLIVSHGGVIRALACALLQLDYHRHGFALAVPPAALLQLLPTAAATAVLEALLPADPKRGAVRHD